MWYYKLLATDMLIVYTFLWSPLAVAIVLGNDAMELVPELIIYKSSFQHPWYPCGPQDPEPPLLHCRYRKMLVYRFGLFNRPLDWYRFAAWYQALMADGCWLLGLSPSFICLLLGGLSHIFVDIPYLNDHCWLSVSVGIVSHHGCWFMVHLTAA